MKVCVLTVHPEPHGLLTSGQSSIASSLVTENDVVLCSKGTRWEGLGHKSWSQNGHRDQNQRPSAHRLPRPKRPTMGLPSGLRAQKNPPLQGVI